MTRRIVIAVSASSLTLLAGVLLAQAPAALKFEVASIRPASPPTPETVQSGQFHRGARIDAAHLDFGFVSLGEILPYAFHVKPYQVVPPDWTHDSRWNILANLPAGSSENQVPEMMQALLADRFKMTVHREKREQSAYELTVATDGLKVERSTGGEFKAWDGSFPGFSFGGGLLRGNEVITGRILDQPGCGMRWEFVPLSMPVFADALAMFLDKPVFDKTGLSGDYKVALDINAETMQAINQNMAHANGLPGPVGGGGGGGRRGGGPPGGGPPPGPAGNLVQCLDEAGQSDGSISMLFKAVQKLGLKLQQGRAPIDTIVVDHLEKTPTEN